MLKLLNKNWAPVFTLVSLMEREREVGREREGKRGGERMRECMFAHARAIRFFLVCFGLVLFIDLNCNFNSGSSEDIIVCIFTFFK